MKKLAMIMALLAVVGLAVTAQGTPTTTSGGYGMSAEVFVTNLGGGLWEYQYDVFSVGHATYWDYFYMKFEFLDGGSAVDHILNMYDPGTGPELREFWTVNGNTDNNGGDGWYGCPEAGPQPSYGDNTTNSWIILPTVPQADANFWGVDPIYAAAEGFANPFHLPNDYAMHMSNPLNTGGDAFWGTFPGMPTNVDGDGLADDLFFDSNRYYVGAMFDAPGGPELMLTVRVVSDLGPYGEVNFQYYASGTAGMGPIVAPGVPEPATMTLLALGGIAALIRRRK